MTAFTQLLFVHNKPLGEGPRNHNYTSHAEHPVSYAWFCPVCMEVWARSVVYQEGKQEPEPAVAWTRGCTEHFLYGNEAPGSLYLPWDATFNSDLPFPALKRELHLLLKEYPE